MQPILRQGDTEIYRIEEYRIPMLPVTEMFLDTDRLRPQIAELGPLDYDPSSDQLVMSSSSYLVRRGQTVILFDTGVGNDKPRARSIWNQLSTTWLDELSAIVDPADVDFVVSTHLHCDHVGWNTVMNEEGEWVPTFPNARYLFNELDREFITSDAATVMLERNGDFRADSITPVFDAGVADIVPLPYEICPGVELVHAPGDTPGHMIARISDPESSTPLALITGDALHHVLQVPFPWLTSSFCSLRQVAEDTRRSVLAECADTGIPMLAGHVASHDLLYIERTPDGQFRVAAPDIPIQPGETP
ncbi:metallo-beta-lactamase superfamily protein [Glaciihabitans tibetensis]|uniref:Metallo-beta-lactamase superfamily protein n=1 Tax=Glaciihabitans tibetensis TaxID=1266600 RepID=A0A2T0VDW0_9MICO|nr:MBL fold metallo-hydrolase [Glaciihabitans tibetensis]PRY68376.1 metallo-beta-lactamase superfamily protein [Glaciihabitans tibetensis]